MQTPSALHDSPLDMRGQMTGVTFVVPVCNGGAHVRETISSIAAQDDGRPMEIIAVDDRSTDDSVAVLQALTDTQRVKIVHGAGRGAAAAINTGVRLAAHPIVCQVDQDVVLEPGWMATVVAALEDPAVAAAQGRYVADLDGSFFARVMSLDLEQRYRSLDRYPDHVCTGNTAYRVSALHAVGLLDDSMGYGYDNDLSYRLQAAGYRLAFCRDARSRHHWREGLVGYLTQQYGFGYGRLDVIARHPGRVTGDAVSPIRMMGHPVVMGVALLLLVTGAAWKALWGDGLELMGAGLALILVLAAERTVSGVRAWIEFGSASALAFPVVHLARDVAWVGAAVAWTLRHLLRRPNRPGHSMSARPASK